METNKSGFALFKVAGIDMSYNDDVPDEPGAVTVAAIEFLAPAAAKRMDADMMSKLLFQQAVRTAPLGIEEIVAAASAMEG